MDDFGQSVISVIAELTPERMTLAIVGGLCFGAIVHSVGSSTRRLVFLLVMLWTLQSGPQFVYRWLEGVDVCEEVIAVSALRVAFTAAAVGGLWLAARWHVR